MYAFFAWTSFKVVALGSGGSSEKQTEDVTAQLMSTPAGQVLVGALGLVVLGVAGYHLYKGWTEEVPRGPRRAPRHLGGAGRPGRLRGQGRGPARRRGLLRHRRRAARPDKAQGLDGALKSLKDMTFGPVLLTVVALGIAAYGVYSFARARYARL